MMTDSALVDKITEEFSSVKWTTIIDSLRPNDTLTIDVSKDPFGDLFLEDEAHFKEHAKKAFIDVKSQRLTGIRVNELFKRLEIKLVSDEEIQMNDINAGVEGHTSGVPGQPVAMPPGIA